MRRLAAIIAVCILATAAAATDFYFCEKAETITMSGNGNFAQGGPWLIECIGPPPENYVVTAEVTVDPRGAWIVTIAGENVELLRASGVSNYAVFNPVTGFVADSGTVTIGPC